jgi:hypothetical protein
MGWEDWKSWIGHGSIQHISSPSSQECGLLRALQSRMLQINTRAFNLQAQISVISSLVSAALLSVSFGPLQPHVQLLLTIESFFETPVVAQPLKKFPSFNGILKVYYHVHRSSLLVPIRSQMNPIHTYIMSLKPILILSFQLRLGFSLWFVLSRHFRLFHLAVVAQLFTKFQPFYATEDSLPGLQVPTTCPQSGSIWNQSTQVYLIWLWDQF